MTSSNPLRLSSELALPLDAVTETFGIIGVKGSGKTTTAHVLVEELVNASQQCVVLDPTGVWWGLKSSADGKREGLPFTILGGDHADIGINDNAGTTVADLVIDDRLNVVVDLSHMRKAEARRFVLAFVEQLYHRNREAMMLVVDEADLFAPQRAVKGAERLQGAMEDLVRRGRVRGIGCCLITQRPASLHKDALSQCSVLVAHRLVGAHDRKAVDQWIEAQGDRERSEQMMQSIAKLDTGTCWFWSPSWVDVFAQVAIRPPTTFDSSATPKPGQARTVPKVLSPVDVDRLRERFAAIVEEVEANDPAALKRKVFDLTRQLAKQPAPRPAATPPAPVEIEVVPAAVVDALSVAAARLRSAHQQLATEADNLADAADSIDRALAALPQPGHRHHRTAPRTPTTAPATAPARASRPTPAPTPANGDRPSIKAGARRILETLARHHPMRMTKAQLGTLAGFKARSSGTFSSYQSALKTNGLIHIGGDGLYEITDDGFGFLGENMPAPMTTDEILERWRQVLKLGARNMLDELIDVYPASLTRDELADRVGLTAGAGTFSSYLSSLRTNGLADVDGDQLTASSTLFLG